MQSNKDVEPAHEDGSIRDTKMTETGALADEIIEIMSVVPYYYRS